MTTISTILEQIFGSKTSEHDKGRRFEEITRIFLLHEPEYKLQYKNVVLWPQRDKRTNSDTGIDLVAEMRDGSGFVASFCCPPFDMIKK